MMPLDPLQLLRQELTQQLSPPPTEARRLFHGRGRRWPGLEHITVDWLQGMLLISLYREPDTLWLDALKETLHSSIDPETVDSLLLHHRYRASDAVETLFGQWQRERIIQENGLRYQLHIGENQNNGLFLDMRHGRRWVRDHARDKRILNLFAYTCAFSVAAIAGDARHVINLDMSKSALSRGRDNHRLNDQPLERVTFLAHELFRSWSKVRKYAPYDLIIIDPPSFQKGSFDLTRDYRKILRRLPDLLADNGQVLACVNDPATGLGFLLDTLREEAPSLRFRQRLDNPPEFADRDPEGGLKALIFDFAR